MYDLRDRFFAYDTDRQTHPQVGPRELGPTYEARDSVAGRCLRRHAGQSQMNTPRRFFTTNVQPARFASSHEPMDLLPPHASRRLHVWHLMTW